MASNCENLNYSVFLSPQQTKLDQFWAHSEWESSVNVIALFWSQSFKFSFASPSKSSWCSHFFWTLAHALKSVECFIMTLSQRRGKCELFTPWRHFSDDTPVSEIVFCFIRDHFLPAVFAPLLIVLAWDGQLRTRQERPCKYHLTPLLHSSVRSSRSHNIMYLLSLFMLKCFFWLRQGALEVLNEIATPFRVNSHTHGK